MEHSQQRKVKPTVSHVKETFSLTKRALQCANDALLARAQMRVQAAKNVMNAPQVRIIMKVAPPVAYVLKIHLAHTVKVLPAKLVFIMSSQRQMLQKHVSIVILASKCQEY